MTVNVTEQSLGRPSRYVTSQFLVSILVAFHAYNYEVSVCLSVTFLLISHLPFLDTFGSIPFLDTFGSRNKRKGV